MGDRFLRFIAGVMLITQSLPSALAECPPTPATEVLDARFIQAIQQSLSCDLFEDRIGPMKVEFLRSFQYGKLTQRWAQQATGADLAKSYLISQDDHNRPLKPAEVGMIDTGSVLGLYPSALGSEVIDCIRQGEKCVNGKDDSSHSTFTANLIVGPFGSAARATIGRLLTPGYDKIGLAADAMAKGPGTPKVVNHSLYIFNKEWDANTKLRDSFHRLAKNTILVFPAYNNFPKPLFKLTKEVPGIVVSSVTPNGLLSVFSQQGPEVAIAAPSNFEISSRSGTSMGTFGGTSGAEPQVTGAIANALEFLPDLTTEETKTLLKNTAIRTAGFNPPTGLDGVGVLNSYKFLRVASRLASGAWKQHRSDLNYPTLYDFTTEAASLREKALKGLASMNCSEKREGLEALRESYFLQPEDPTNRRILAGLYRQHGFESQAQYVEGLPSQQTVRRTIGAFARIVAEVRAPHFKPTERFLARLKDLTKKQAGIVGSFLIALHWESSQKALLELAPLVDVEGATKLGQTLNSYRSPIEAAAIRKYLLPALPSDSARKAVLEAEESDDLAK